VLTLASVRPRNLGMVVAGAYAATVALLAAFALSTHYALSLVLMLGLSGTMTAYMSSTNTMIQSTVPDALRGRVMSLYVLAGFGTAPLGGLLMGSLASAFGAQTAVLIGAAVCGLGAALWLWAARRGVGAQVYLPAEGQP